jgi:hypothetical protein
MMLTRNQIVTKMALLARSREKRLMEKLGFCSCSQKGNYEMGIFALATGELACKNCRGVIPPSDLSEEILQRPAPQPKQKISTDYRMELDKKTPSRSGPASMDDLVKAQNRTTHAVRSLAITLVAAPIISIAIVIAVVIASASGNTTIVIFAGVLGALIGIGTLVVALDELAKSKVR